MEIARTITVRRISPSLEGAASERGWYEVADELLVVLIGEHRQLWNHRAPSAGKR